MDDGEIVYNLIHESLVHGDQVELDFDGVEIFASPFFNAGVGRLLVDLNPDALNKLLKFNHLSDFGSRVLRRVIDNAKDYYAFSTDQRNKVDQVLTSDFHAA